MFTKKHLSKKILIVDDDTITGSFLEKRLARRGLDTLYLSDETKTHDTLAKGEFALVLLDIMMPKIDGISLLQEIRKNYSRETLPVIMISAYGDSSDLSDAFKYGANDYITKPIDIDAAAARITGQLSISKIHTTEIQKTESETLVAMAVACHHEINNPLAIAVTEMQLLLKELKPVDHPKVERALNALYRIKDILKSIDKLTEGDSANFKQYANSNLKMVNLKK